MDREKRGTADQLRVVLYLNGTLGDQSFFDSTHRGMERAIEEFGIVGRTVEGGWDPSNWQPDITQLAEGNWDIVIAGTWQLAEYVGEIAPDHPDKMFITYDTAVDFSQGDLDNVYSILYSQNEGSFLTGALGGLYLSMGYVSWFSRDMTAGRGFIAVAAATMGGNLPLGTAVGSLLFGFVNAAAIYISSLDVPSELIQTIPYVTTVIALTVYAARRSRRRRRHHTAVPSDRRRGGPAPTPRNRESTSHDTQERKLQ